jgi:MFS family permease
LNLSNNQYAICLTVFFISYALFEAPSNLLLKRLKPHIWIPIIMTGWGIVMTSMGFVVNFNGLAVSRFFLGVTEAGLYPSINNVHPLILKIPWDCILSLVLV